MKRIFFLAILSAIALTGTTFTACSSAEDAVEPNPTYDGTSVRTDFAFSITKATQTRMMSADVQEGYDSKFLGMRNMYLLPFKGEPGIGTNKEQTTNAANFPLGVLTTSDITNTPGDEARENENSTKIYSLTLPIGTKNFLFYGTANSSGTNFQIGQLASTLNKDITDISDISFSLTSIATGLGTDATTIANYLTTIANTEDWAETVTTAKTDGTYRALADLYTKFTSNAAPRAGSAEAVKRLVLDLYKSAWGINEQSSVNEVKAIAQRICNVINAEGKVVNVIASDGDPDNWTAEIKVVNSTFPSNLGLPMGAAQLKWKESDQKFFYKGDLYSIGSLDSDGNIYDNFKIDQYRYPAQLVYFDNSPLRASTNYKTPNDFPKSAKAWDEGFTTDDWKGSEVLPSTRAVAMQNNVNYGVALLISTVKLGGAGDYKNLLTDNMDHILGAPESQKDIDGKEFKVTGMLIGGQPTSVDWDMTNPDDAFEQVIYDNEITFEDTNLSNNASTSNYTIVLDNFYKESTMTTVPDQKKVLIALEIKNGTRDFYGRDGMIPAGSTFYLVGELDPNSTTTGHIATTFTNTSRPDSYRITQESVKRVFVQDYKTTANFTISTEALRNAYSTIPDLRSTETVFGLSVDLTWEPGFTFNVNIK